MLILQLTGFLLLGHLTSGQYFPPANIYPFSECNFEAQENDTCHMAKWSNSPRNFFSFYPIAEEVRLVADDTTATTYQYLTTPVGAKGSAKLASTFVEPSPPRPVRALCISFLHQVSGDGASLTLMEYRASTPRQGRVLKKINGSPNSTQKAQWRLWAWQVESSEKVKFELIAQVNGGSSFVSIDDLAIYASSCSTTEGSDELSPVNASVAALYRRLPLNQQWNNGVVPFVIVPGFDDAQVLKLKETMAELSLSRCVQFRPRRPNVDQDYVEFLKVDDSCVADVGKRGEKQQVRLADQCFTRSILSHTLLHVLGLRHENIRPDRDRFINVLWNNINPNKRKFFEIYQAIDPRFLNATYDKQSVMHFASNEYAKQAGLRTLESKINASERLGPAVDDGPTLADFQKLANVYCPGVKFQRLPGSTPRVRTTTTQMPEDNRPCRSITTINSSAKQGSIASYIRTNGLYRNSEACSWLIQLSTPGKSVQLSVVVMDLEPSPGCEKDSLTIFDGANDNSPIIFQACGSKRPLGTIQSLGSQALVLFSTDSSTAASGFVLEWREVDRNFEEKGVSALSPVDCPFSVSACGWTNFNQVFMWKRKDLQGIGDHTTDGEMPNAILTADAASQVRGRNVAQLRSRRLKAADDYNCFSFWYRKVDDSRNAGRLDLFLVTDTSSADRLLWTSESVAVEVGDPYTDWVQVLVPIVNHDGAVIYSLHFNATIPAKKPNSGIAIDDVQITQQSCLDEISDDPEQFITPKPVNVDVSLVPGFSCDFEANLCQWRNANPSALWLNKSVRPGFGKSILFNSSSGEARIARLETSVEANSGFRCISVMYFMNGPKSGNLSIRASSPQRGEMVLFEASGQKESSWLKASANIEGLFESYAARIEARTWGDANGDILVDNLTVSTSPCFNDKTIASLEESSTPVSSCNFETGSMCSSTLQFFLLSTDPSFRWQQSTAVMFEMFDKSEQSLDGRIAAVRDGRRGKVASLQTKYFLAGEANCFAFWYNLGQFTPVDASLSVIFTSRQASETVLWTISGSNSPKNKWLFGQVPIPLASSGSEFAIRFQAFSGGNGTIFALDSLTLTKGSSCPAVGQVSVVPNAMRQTLNCSFNAGNFCDWQAGQILKTSCPAVGNCFVHLTSGLLVDSTTAMSKLPSYLSSPPINQTSGGCLRFLYRMTTFWPTFQNSAGDTINVYLQNVADQARRQLLASYSTSQARGSVIASVSGDWLESKITLFESEPFIIVLELINSDSMFGSVAIDDLMVINVVCSQAAL